MEYLSSFTIYQEVIDGMDAMGITKEEFAENLHMSVEELDEFPEVTSPEKSRTHITLAQLLLSY